MHVEDVGAFTDYWRRRSRQKKGQNSAPRCSYRDCPSARLTKRTIIPTSRSLATATDAIKVVLADTTDIVRIFDVPD